MVANKVRKLAENTQKSPNEIELTITNVPKNLESISHTAQDHTSIFTIITQDGQTSKESLENIQCDMNEVANNINTQGEDTITLATQTKNIIDSMNIINQLLGESTQIISTVMKRSLKLKKNDAILSKIIRGF